MLMYAIWHKHKQSETVDEPVALYWTRDSAERALFGDMPEDKHAFTSKRDFLRSNYVIKPVDVSCAPVREVQS